jgi:hypothetical protein
MPVGFSASSSQFNKVHGHDFDIEEAVKVLIDLLSVGPSLHYYIISGLQLLDCQDSTPRLKACLQELVDALCKLTNRSGSSEKVIKVLFTTDGPSQTLKQALKGGCLRTESFEDEEESEPLRLRYPPNGISVGSEGEPSG